MIWSIKETITKIIISSSTFTIFICTYNNIDQCGGRPWWGQWFHIFCTISNVKYSRNVEDSESLVLNNTVSSTLLHLYACELVKSARKWFNHQVDLGNFATDKSTGISLFDLRYTGRPHSGVVFRPCQRILSIIVPRSLIHLSQSMSGKLRTYTALLLKTTKIHSFFFPGPPSMGPSKFVWSKTSKDLKLPVIAPFTL